MIKDESSNAGKARLAFLMFAKASRAIVRIYGPEPCTRWPDGEDIDVILIP